MTTKVCGGCRTMRVIEARGLCNACYLRARRSGTVEKHALSCAPPTRTKGKRRAECEGCGEEKEIRGRGLCNACYCRARRGKGEFGRRIRSKPAEWEPIPMCWGGGWVKDKDGYRWDDQRTWRREIHDLSDDFHPPADRHPHRFVGPLSKQEEIEKLAYQQRMDAYEEGKSCIRTPAAEETDRAWWQATRRSDDIEEHEDMEDPGAQPEGGDEGPEEAGDGRRVPGSGCLLEHAEGLPDGLPDGFA